MRRSLLWGMVLGGLALGACRGGGAGEDAGPVYQFAQPSSEAGTGKRYMGREIASVTDHDLQADWLERPQREASEFPRRLVQALEVRPTDVVADIGAGTGYFTFRLSPQVPQGQVLAVDIQDEMLARIRLRMEEEGITNITPILGTAQDPNLGASTVDLALIVCSYHEFSHPREMMAHIVTALKPGGRLVLVEYRGEDRTLQVDPLHRMDEAQARKEMVAVGLIWVQTKDVLPQQHFMVFEKPR